MIPTANNLKRHNLGRLATLVLSVSILSLGLSSALADELVMPPPVDKRTEGAGPYERLILRGAYMIDGTGAPAQGPVDIVIEDDRITEIKIVGAPNSKIDPAKRPPLLGGQELDLEGMYVLPGFIDTHLHLHTENTGQATPPEYILKLWLSHGITHGRSLGSPNLEWMLETSERLDNNEITGPRMEVYPMFGSDATGFPTATTAEEARDQIRAFKKMGVSGIKFIGGQEDVLSAAIDETVVQNLNSTMHHAQIAVMHSNVLDTSAAGLQSMEHWYGLPEAMFEDKRIQDYPAAYIYNNEQDRFGEAGRLWAQTAAPGSEKWNEVMTTLLERNFGLSPTFNAYIATRDVMRMSNANWQADYALPVVWEWFRPNRDAHGSYWFYWTLEDEIAWRNNYVLWMQFVNEYKNRGGLVSIGSDSGYTYNLYGFGFVQEMHLLREAGFSPLEVVNSATLQGARQLRIDEDYGSLEVGKKADVVVVAENPLENLHVLFGTGTIKLNDDSGEIERIGGIRYTIKDGIVYDSREIRKELRDLVNEEKSKLGLPPGAMPIETVPFDG